MKKTYLLIPTLALMLTACSQKQNVSEKTKHQETIQELSKKTEDFSNKNIEEINEIIDSVDSKIEEEQKNINEQLKTL